MCQDTRRRISISISIIRRISLRVAAYSHGVDPMFRECNIQILAIDEQTKIKIIDRIFENFHGGYSFPSKGLISEYRWTVLVSIISLVLQEWTREIKRKKEEEWKTIDGGGLGRNYRARSNTVAADRFYSSERSGPKLEEEEGRKREGRGTTDKVEEGTIPG